MAEVNGAEVNGFGRKVKTPRSRAAKRTGNMTSVIYDELRVKILNGQLRAGAPLSIVSIAKAGGTSPSPVREALRRLQQDHLVVAQANKRFNIALFDVSDLEAVLSLHLVNITLAIRASVPFLTAAEIAELERCTERMDKVRDCGEFEWEEIYREFVFVLIKHSGERTMALIGNLIDDIQRYRANVLSESHSVLRPQGPIFGLIIEAASIRDGRTASLLYADLFGHLGSLILSSVAPDYDAYRLRDYKLALMSIGVAL